MLISFRPGSVSSRVDLLVHTPSRLHQVLRVIIQHKVGETLSYIPFQSGIAIFDYAIHSMCKDYTRVLHSANPDHCFFRGHFVPHCNMFTHTISVNGKG